MTIFEFNKTIEKLEVVFSPLSSEQRDIYYNIFNNIDSYIFNKAINILLKTHPTRRFPLIAEIKAAIKEAYNESNYGDRELEGCEKCNYTGIQLHPVLHLGWIRMTAFPCDCEKGRSIQRGWEKYRKSRL